MKIAAYCRVSTDKAEQIDSLRHQKEFFQEYARRNGHQLVALYADEGISGVSLRRREAFLRLMQDAEEGKFQIVAVKDVSRFARNTVDFLQSIRRLKSLGVNTLFLTANMDSLGESEFVLTLFSALAQEESANLSKRVKFGKKLNAKKGRVPSSIFGYDRLDNFHLAVNPREAETVQEIYRLYIEEGLGCRAISSQLNHQGKKTRSGSSWTPRGVRRVLENSIYCGDYVNNKSETQDYLTGRRISIPDSQRFHHYRPEWAVISPETYQKAQQISAARRTQYNAKEPNTRYSGKHLFSTLIRCAQCGGSFCRKRYTYANTRIYWKCTANDQRTAAVCRNTVKLEEPDLLTVLREYFSALIPDKSVFLESVITEASQRLRRQKDSKGEDPERTRKRLEFKRERCQEMYINGVITMAELQKKTAAITAGLEALEHRQQKMLPDAQTQRIQYRQEIERFINLEAIVNTDIRRLVERILVHEDGRVEIYLKDLRTLSN